MALFALNLMHSQRRLKISHVKNVSNFFKLRAVAFRLAPPYGGLLVKHPENPPLIRPNQTWPYLIK